MVVGDIVEKKDKGVWAWVSGDGRLLSLGIGGKVGRVEWFKGSGEEKKKRRPFWS